jgi:hypothetical protein
MRNLNIIAEELFNKIRGRFPSVTIGNAEGKVTNIPKEARYYDFDFKEGDRNLGKVSVSIDEENIAVMYSNDFVTQEDTLTKNSWYDFLKEIRVFAKKRMLSFDTRDINKSNLDKRDYQFLAANRNDITMESMMYGTSKTSYQNIGGARLAIKHSSPVNPERRTHHVSSIYIESAEGERFKYPYKHLNGARAMARHVAEGGTPYDEFGKHVTGLSEELAKLKKFKSYMGRSAVMAESLKDYVDVVKERANYIKKEITNLQKSNHYKQAFESFEAPILEDVPVDVAENWIDQLTIKQFNEELKDVFPYIYKLVSEATKAKELGVDDLIGEGLNGKTYKCKDCGDEMHKPTTTCGHDCDDETGSWWRDENGNGINDRVEEGEEQPADSYMVKPGDTIYGIAKRFAESNYDGDIEAGVKDIMELNNITDPEGLQPGQKLDIGYFMGGMKSGATRGLPSGGFKSYDEEIDAAFEQSMGQFKDMEIAPEKPQLPVTEYIMSMYDRETGNFPKGETAVLTAVEKDYGEEFIEPSKNFIERMTTLFAGQNQTQKDPELAAFEAKLAERNKTKKIDPMDPEKPEDMMGDYDDDEDIEETGLQYKTGVDKHGKEYMVKAAQAGREGASQEEIGALRDKYSKAEKNKTSEEVNRIKHLSGI